MLAQKKIIGLASIAMLAASPVAAEMHSHKHGEHHNKHQGLYDATNSMGHIIVVGKVTSSVEHAKEIKVQDKHGKMFHIHTKQSVTLPEGAMIRISGTTDAKVPAWGATVKDARVQSLEPLNSARSRGQQYRRNEQSEFDIFSWM